MKEPEAAVAEEAVGRAEVSIEELELSSRVAGALRNGGIRTVEDLMKTDEQELLAIRGFGAKSLEQVRASLKAKGFVKA
ncbi:MAG: DNA-directed RNA polymerase subunit alpha C-terminal domain-containing protein [Anaerolineae bacterium]